MSVNFRCEYKMATPAYRHFDRILPPCLNNGSNGQTKQDLAVQHHQLHKQFQALQFFCHPHPSLCCKTWTLLASYEKGTEAFETKCMRKLLRVSYLEHKTNDWVRSKINFFVGPQEPLPATGKRRKHAWFGHVTLHDSILQGTLDGGRRRGRQR